LRAAALLLGLLALAVQAVQVAGARPAAAPMPADFCGAPAGADGDGPANAHDGAGSCPCCRAHPPLAFAPVRAAMPAQYEGDEVSPRPAASGAQFDPLFEWRSLFAQGPPLSG
jgi:hypothetical protein